jgi:hypothetical protein
LNPVIFLRPLENANGSPDNELLGGTIKFRLNPHHVLYGQLMLDELLIDSVKAGNGWWGNKQAFQVGYKGFSLFKIKNLNVQTEFNFVRPFVYAHRSRLQNYAHYNQALAHPLGANFIESISFVNYKWKNLFVQFKFMYSQAGLDPVDTLNYGSDIFKDYDSRTNESGNYMFSGLKTTIQHSGLQVNYLINPKTNLIVKAGVDFRIYSNEQRKENTQFVYFGIATALDNFYFDF